MKKDKGFIRAYLKRDEDGGEAELGSPISFVAATEGTKRDGLDIDIAAGDLENYKANPVVLWAHDYWGERPPIGRGENLRVEGTELVVDITFDQSDEFARSIEQKYRDHFLNAVSIGFNPTEIEGNKVEAWDLLDISAVPVPGDPQALMERASISKEYLRKWAADYVRFLDGIKDFPVIDLTLEDDPDPENEVIPDVDEIRVVDVLADDTSEAIIWAGTSVAMIGVFMPESAIDDEKRKSVYILLERLYRRLGKTAPEFMDLEEIQSLDPESIRGLFLESEPVGMIVPGDPDPGDEVFEIEVRYEDLLDALDNHTTEKEGIENG